MDESRFPIGAPPKDRPRILVDFNTDDGKGWIFLAKADVTLDSSGTPIHLEPGLRVYVYEEDFDENEQPDNLIAEGYAVRFPPEHHCASYWYCQVEDQSLRHESNLEAGIER